MSVLGYFANGGMVSMGGDLPDDEKKSADSIVRKFGNAVRHIALSMQVPASMLNVQKSRFLFVAKDTSSLHFVFADAPGGNQINYRNLSSFGRLELQSMLHQVRLEVGEVSWAFTTPLNLPEPELDAYINKIAVQYVNSVLQSQSNPSKKISDEAVSSPEIASGLEKFRKDYPMGTKTAFIIMQFGNTKPHQSIVATIKATLQKHGITAMRADDKEYMEDLFPNIKTYMHACDFGVAVFDRITEDDFNPNVSLEVGYMMGMGKNVLLLKDKTLRSLQTDLTGKLYKQFDTTDIDSTMPAQIEKWLTDKGLA